MKMTALSLAIATTISFATLAPAGASPYYVAPPPSSASLPPIVPDILTGPGPITFTNSNLLGTIQQLQNDVQQAQTAYGQYQQLVSETSQLSSLQFSGWPSLKSTLAAPSGAATSDAPDGSYASSVCAQAASATDSDDAQLQNLATQVASVQGTTGATELQSEISSLTGAEQQQQAQCSQALAVTPQQGQVYELYLFSGSLDMAGDPDAGWGWGT